MATKSTVQLLMPEMGESVTEGTVLEWLVAEGDAVEEGQNMVEVSTDKVDAEVPAPASGTVAKILVQPDETIEVGKPLAEIDAGATGTGSGAVSAVEAPDSVNGETPANAPSPAPTTPAAPAEEDDAAAEPSGAAIQIVMPEMGESVTEGTVLEWHVAEGDPVEEGQTVVEVSTDKVDAEVPAPANGTIAKIMVGPDETIEVGKPLGEMVQGAAAAASGADSASDRPVSASGEAPAYVPSSAPAAPSTAADDDAKATPVAKRIAAANGVSLGAVKGTGAGGKVTKADVLAASGDGKAPAPAPAALEGEARPLRGPAAMLAKAMEESREIPTATSFRTLAVDTLDAKRKALNGVLKERGMKVSFTHLIAWAIVKAAQEFPVMARHFEQIDGKPHAVEPGSINLGIAVDVERKGQRSLMVPCIKGADTLDFAGFHSLLRGADHQDPREQADRGRLPGHQHQPHQPGRDRHDRLRPPPDERPGNDHRLRLARLPGRVGARPGGQGEGARREQGDDDHLDLRPSRHPGGGIRIVPAPDRGAAAGRGRVLRIGRARPRGG